MLLQDLLCELKDGLRRLAQDTACSVRLRLKASSVDSFYCFHMAFRRLMTLVTCSLGSWPMNLGQENRTP